MLTILMNVMHYSSQDGVGCLQIQVNQMYLRHATCKAIYPESGEGHENAKALKSAEIYPSSGFLQSELADRGQSQSFLELQGLPVDIWIRPKHSLRKLNSGHCRKVLGTLKSGFLLKALAKQLLKVTVPAPKGILVSSSQVIILNGNVLEEL